MKKRRLAAPLAIVLALALAGGLLLSFSTPTQFVSREACDRIQSGMKLQAVETLLGASPEYYAPKAGGAFASWRGDGWTVVVEFDAAGDVVGKSFVRGPERSFLDRVRGWFGSGK